MHVFDLASAIICLEMPVVLVTFMAMEIKWGQIAVAGVVTIIFIFNIFFYYLKTYLLDGLLFNVIK